MPPFAVWAFVFTTIDLVSVFSGLFSQIVVLLAGFEHRLFVSAMGLAGGLGEVESPGGTRPSYSVRQFR